MPLSATNTAFYSFSTATVIRSAQVNTNFSAMRGHYLPIDVTAAASAPTQTFDLGSPDHRWRNVYGSVAPLVASTTGSMSVTGSYDVFLLNTTSGTATADIITAVGFVGMITIKNIGTGSKTAYLDAHGTEKIDNTTTVNLVDNESTTLISDNANWWSI